MNGNQLFVKNWISRYCPTFLNILPADSVFLSLTVENTVERHTQLFLRSTYPNWSEHPMYSQLLDAATAEGKLFFEKMITANTYGVSASSNGVIFGTPAGARSLRSNLTASGTIRSLLHTALGPFNPSLPYFTQLSADAGVLVPQDVFVTKPYVKVCLDALKKIGVLDVKGPFLCNAAAENWAGLGHSGDTRASLAADRANRASTEIRAACGPNRFPLHFMRDPGGSGKIGAMGAQDVIFAPYYYTVGMVDDSVSEWVQDAGYGDWQVLTSAQYPPTGNPTESGLGPEYNDMYQFISRLNPAKVPASLKGVHGLERLDDYWLPLCVLPGKHQILARSKPADIEFINAEPDGPKVTSLVARSADVVCVLPIAWYVDYANEQIAKGAKNADALKQAVIDMAVYDGKSITIMAYAKPEFLEADIVFNTQLYRDYKKAREKACEEDEFASLPFTSEMTYGALNTLINGSRSTRVFYGYRDSGESPVLDYPLPESTAGWTLTCGQATVTSRRADGTFGPTYGASNGDEFIVAATSGATLVGGTVDSQLTLWGFDPAIVNTQSLGLKQAYFNAAGSMTKGSPTAYYDFRWESVGMTGIPDVKHMTTDTKNRAVMTSKGVLSGLGNALREILMEELTSFQSDITLDITPKP